MHFTLAFFFCILPFLGAVLSEKNATGSTRTAKKPHIFSKDKKAIQPKPTFFVASRYHLGNTSTFVKSTSVRIIETTPFLIRYKPEILVFILPRILQPNCTGQLSCAGRCTYRLDFERGKSTPSCFCDPLCDSVFQDCCADYDEECNATWMTQTFPKSDLDTRWECSNVYGESDDIWMVGSCSSNWAKDEVSKKCTKYKDFPGISVHIPVIGNNVTFRNRYCALCNNVDVFTSWKYDVDCDVIPPRDYTDLESVAFMDSFCHPYSLSLFLSDQLLFRCYKKETKCLYKDDKSAVEGCQTGPTGLVARFGYNYRNLDCLRCSFLVRGDFIPMCGPQIFQVKYSDSKIILSFGSIFKGSQLRSPARRPQCPDGHIFDKVSQVCKKPLGKQDLSAQSPFQRHFVSMQYKEVNNSCLVSFLYAGPEKNRLRFRFVFEKLLDISLVESGWQITDLDVQTQRNGSYFVTFQVFGKLDAGETHLDTPLQYSKINNIVFHSKLLLNGICSYTITNATVRAMFCAENDTYPARNEGDFSENTPIFINETKQYYYPGQYLVYKEHNGRRLAVCKDFKPANCSGYLEVKNKTLWEMFPNRSIYSNATESLFEYGEYSILNGTLWLCLTKDHLENTIGISSADLWPSQIHRDILNYTTVVTFAISLISLVVLLVVYSVFPSLRNLPGKNLMLLCCVLGLGQLLWLLQSEIYSLSQTVCVVTLQYLLLAEFCCSTSISFHSFVTFHGIAKGKLRQSCGPLKTFIWYAMFSLGFPLVLVTVFWLLDHFEVISLDYGGERCWFVDQRSIYIAFIAPVYTILFINILFLLITLRLIHKCTKESQKIVEKNGGPNKKHIGIYLRMSTLTGLTWLFGIFLPIFPKVLAFDYLFVITNGLQGFYIAVAFLFTDNVKKKISRKLFRSETTSTTRSTSGAKSIR